MNIGNKSYIKDELYMHFNVKRKDFRGAEQLIPLLEMLEKSFLPKPEKLETTGLKSQNINKYLDAKVRKALDRKKYPVEIFDNEQAAYLVIAPALSFTNISLKLHPSVFSTVEVSTLRELFADTLNLILPKVARCHLDKYGSKLYKKYYKKNERNPWLPGLYWLSFIGAEELARQGGEAIANNQYAKVSSLSGGFLLEVGESPFDCLTPEGEDLLVKATKAMPVIQ